jgi:hypothetical protein
MTTQGRTSMTLALALFTASDFSLLERFRKLSNSAFSRRYLSCSQAALRLRVLA